jgi:hypothetical protein
LVGHYGVCAVCQAVADTLVRTPYLATQQTIKRMDRALVPSLLGSLIILLYLLYVLDDTEVLRRTVFRNGPLPNCAAE